MATQIKILEWSAAGLRCPDHRISLLNSKGDTHRVSLIQMPNGTGKTTTLSLIRAALSGDEIVGSWSDADVSSFAKEHGGTSVGQFAVVLLIDGQRYTFTIKFNFGERRAEILTTTPSGQRRGFHVPTPIIRLFRSSFVELFVFDGELADELLKSDRTRADVAVDNLFQLDYFNRIVERLKEDWDDRVRDKTAKQEKGLERRRNRVERLKALVTQYKRERANLQARLEKLKTAVDDRGEKYESELERKDKDREALHGLRAEFERSRGELRRQVGTVLVSMRNPAAFREQIGASIVRFKDALDKAKLPEKAAREFFEELAQEELCICGRSLDNETRAYIKEHASHYLGTDEHALLNAIKEDIGLYLGVESDAPHKDLERCLNALAKVSSEHEDIRNSIVLREEELRRGDPHLESIHLELEKDRQQISELIAQLTKYDDPTDVAGDEHTFGIAVLERRLENAEKQLAEATETVKVRKAIQLSTAILEEAHKGARSKLAEVVAHQANDRIKTLMPDNNVFIDRIQGNLKLRGKNKGSAGENLSIAYAFLSTMFNNSDHKLPFIVDSPAGPIDLSIRPQIAKLVPKLSNQFIAFTISSERQKFSSDLQDVELGDVQFLTLFRDRVGSKTPTLASIPSSHITRTVDGVVVEDAGYFNEFQLDRED